MTFDMTIGDRIGLVVNARSAWPDNATLAKLGKSWLRTIVYSFDDLDAALLNVPAGVRVIALLNSETAEVGPQYENWYTALKKFTDRFVGRVAAVECGNEWDSPTIQMEPTKAAWLAHSAGFYLGRRGIIALLGSVSGPNWPDALNSACREIEQLPGGSKIGGVCLHPYGRNGFNFPGYPFGEIDEAVQQAAALAGGLPVYVTEFGGPMGELQGAFGQSKYLNNCFNELGKLPRNVLAAACYFAWRDDIGGPDQRDEENAFGLVTTDGQERPAMQAYYTFCRRSMKNGPSDEGDDTQ